MESETEVKYWLKHLKITREQLQSIVEKVGNSAASVRKELKRRNKLAYRCASEDKLLSGRTSNPLLISNLLSQLTLSFVGDSFPSSRH
jgi:hypothetical protein